MTEAQKEYYLIEKGEFVELANVHTEGISPARIFDISVRVMARPYKSSDKETCMRGLQKCSKDCDGCPDNYTCSESSK